MSNFQERLLRWTPTISSGRNGYDRAGGEKRESKYSSTELLTPDSEFTQARSDSFSLVWRPVLYTGWHTGVLTCAISVIIVLFTNVSLAIYTATSPDYKMERGVGTLYEGRCDKTPIRREIDAAHARRRWMCIGVPSVMNLFKIKLERTLLWIAIGFTSIPLHLLYNSAVYTSLAANDFLVTAVAKDYFERGAYSNITEAFPLYFYQPGYDNSTGVTGYTDNGTPGEF
ncbi:hypothetical protein B9Z19DRAFT_1127454 [Tuber borchii]|uniref:DUF6536 domain-containing protein n=1 Tax=Tuber borchii TaxID=42251 RepID=A0A2T6ZRB6_TUBBO|nr:hypothetical protein B9Z19DRAFT_1127454 [Tuber borchii]